MRIRNRLLAAGMAALSACAQAQPAPEPQDTAQIGAPEREAGDKLVQATLRAAARFQPKAEELFCYRYVKLGVQSALGASLTGLHAYQAAEQLAQSPCFRELGGARKQLNPEEIPRGAVVVWQPTRKYPSGHIFVSMGKGREISDRIRPMSTNYGSSARVFIPQAGCLLRGPVPQAAPATTD